MTQSAKWELAETRSEEAARLAGELSISPIFAQILLNRGFCDASSIRLFLAPQLKNLSDPLPPDPAPGSFHSEIRKGVERILLALERDEKITLYGDYDVDGVASIAILYRFLSELVEDLQTVEKAGAALPISNPVNPSESRKSCLNSPPATRRSQLATFLPDRFDEGYGLTPSGVERCLKESKPDLLVVLDCGTNSKKEVENLKEKGIEVIIIDHHEPEPTQQAAPIALINYKLQAASHESRVASCGDPNAAVPILNSQFSIPNFATEYCTAGLVFKFCHALLKKIRQLSLSSNLEPRASTIDLKDYLDLVALATVADIAPLTGENRILVRQGLKQMANTRWPGLRALMRVSGLSSGVRSFPDKKRDATVGPSASRLAEAYGAARVSLQPPVSTYDCAFKLGPRLNAAGRLESAVSALRLFLSENAQEVENLAAQLDGTNRERQQEEARVLLESRELALAQIQSSSQAVLGVVPQASNVERRTSNFPPLVLVVSRPGWHEGVVGIVASRLAREFHLPTVVLALDGDDMAKGSGRSVEGFDWAMAIEATRAFLIRGGGHKMAAGVTIRGERIESWRLALQEHARVQLNGKAPQRFLHLDVEIQFSQLNPSLVVELENLEPCGTGLPRPVFLARRVEIAEEPRRVGAESRHLKLRLRQEGICMDGIAFGMGRWPVSKGQFLDVAFELEENEFRGQKKLQLNIREILERANG